MLIGAAAVISDYNGTAKASHIKDKLVEMAYLNENIAGTAMAASYQSNQMPAGNYQPNVLSEWAVQLPRLLEGPVPNLLLCWPARVRSRRRELQWRMSASIT